MTRMRLMTSDLKKQTLYQKIEHLILKWIEQGQLLPGDKLPSVRELSLDLKVSKSTIIQAYTQLEMKGFIHAKPQSGFYLSVSSQTHSHEVFKDIQFKSNRAPGYVQTTSKNLLYVRSVGDNKLIQLGAAAVDEKLLPVANLARSLNRVLRHDTANWIRYEKVSGHPDLRQWIAKRFQALGVNCESTDVVITNGCTEAIKISLQIVTEPGDIVAVESPTYYSFLRLLQDQNLKILEISTRSRGGLDLDDLELKLQKHSVRAIILNPNYSNPLGSQMSDDSKKRLIDLCYRYQCTLIEDDIYAELSYQGQRPLPAKTFDQKDEVFLCSSFSKTLCPGFRVGWILPPKKFSEKVELIKASHSLANSSLTQQALVDYFSHYNYNKHLRKLRTTLFENVQKIIKCVELYFPAGTQVALPQGGCLLWVQFPEVVQSNKLFDICLRQNIGIIPGTAFSCHEKFSNHIRLNAGVLWNDQIEAALKFIGKAAQQMLKV